MRHASIYPDKYKGMLATVEESKDRLRKKLEVLKARRCGTGIRSARSMVSKSERHKLQKEVRKKGVEALTAKLGITDPEMKTLIINMIRDGDATTIEEILKKLGEIQGIDQHRQREKKAQMDEESKKLQGVAAPAEVVNTDFTQEVISTLPGARRKGLKPLNRLIQ